MKKIKQVWRQSREIRKEGAILSGGFWKDGLYAENGSLEGSRQARNLKADDWEQRTWQRWQRDVSEGIIRSMWPKHGDRGAGIRKHHQQGGRDGSWRVWQALGRVRTHSLSSVGRTAMSVEEVSCETDSWLCLQTKNEIPCLPVRTQSNISESIFLDFF